MCACVSRYAFLHKYIGVMYVFVPCVFPSVVQSPEYLIMIKGYSPSDDSQRASAKLCLCQYPKNNTAYFLGKANNFSQVKQLAPAALARYASSTSTYVCCGHVHKRPCSSLHLEKRAGTDYSLSLSLSLSLPLLCLLLHCL